jgi:methionyl-tRNA formyltransferase
VATSASKILFCGSKSLGLGFLKKLHEISQGHEIVVCHPDDRIDTRSVSAEFESFCHNSELFFSYVANEAELQKFIAVHNPDIAIVCGWYKIISPSTLSLVPRGFIGVHNSLLPKNRGGAPVVWAMIHGAREIGSSMFMLSEGIDEGDIIKQVSVTRLQCEPVGSVLSRLEKKVEEQFPCTLLRYIENPWTPSPQRGTPSTFPNRRPGDGLVDFTKASIEVCNFINAQSEPYPGAFFFRNGKPVWLRAARCENQNLTSATGQLPDNLSHEPRTLKFLCGDGKTIEAEEWPNS